MRGLLGRSDAGPAERRHKMIRFQHRLEIDRGPGAVFDALTDVELIPQWQSNVIAVSKQTSGPVRAGTQIRQTVKMAGRREANLSVAAYMPHELVAFSGDVGVADYYCAFELTPRADGGTTVAARTEFRLHGLWRLLRPILGGEIRREMREELAALKRLLEAEQPDVRPAMAN